MQLDMLKFIPTFLLDKKSLHTSELQRIYIIKHIVCLPLRVQFRSDLFWTCFYTKGIYGLPMTQETFRFKKEIELCFPEPKISLPECFKLKGPEASLIFFLFCQKKVLKDDSFVGGS